MIPASPARCSIATLAASLAQTRCAAVEAAFEGGLLSLNFDLGDCTTITDEGGESRLASGFLLKEIACVRG